MKAGRSKEGRSESDPGLTDPPSKLREGEGRMPGPVEVSRPLRSSRKGGKKVKHG